LIPFEPLGRGEQNKILLLDMPQYFSLCRYVDNLRKINKTKIKIMFEEQPEQLSEIKTADWGKYKRCVAGVTFFSVLHDGNIVGCINCDRKEQHVYGNIKTDDIDTIWQESFCVERDKKYQYCNNHYYLSLTGEKNENKN